MPCLANTRTSRLRVPLIRGSIARLTTTSLTVLALVAAAACDRDMPRLLILITVDTLRSDRLGAYGNPLGLTPNLDALAQTSLVFQTVYAPTPSTLPSISALLTGHYPGELGIRGNRSVLPPGIPTLATQLRGRGWSTGAVVSNAVLSRGAGLDAGFDLYDHELPQREVLRGWPERVASSTTDACLAMLDALAEDGKPTFLWVHYQDPHGPYTPPEGHRARYLEIERAAPDGAKLLPEQTGAGHGDLPGYQSVDDEREVAFYRAGYNGEVAYLDEEIGRLLQALSDRGLDDEAVIVFTADHGESLGEDDYWFAHGEKLIEPLVRVPLLIRAPSIEPGRRDDVVSLTDLFTTLLGLTVGAPEDSTGRDLLEPGSVHVDSEPYLATLRGSGVASYGIVDGDYTLLITRSNGDWIKRLYRRDGRGVAQDHEAPELTHRLLMRLLEIRSSLPQHNAELRQRLSKEENARLNAMGYIEATQDPTE